MAYVWHFRFPMEFLLGKKYCSCEDGHTLSHTVISGLEKWPAQRVIDDKWMEVEVWWMVMDDRCRSSQIQSADHWRCRAFSKTVVWPGQRNLPGKECGIQPVHRHISAQCQPSWKAPGAPGIPVLVQQTKLRWGKKKLFIAENHNNTQKKSFKNFEFHVSSLSSYPFSWLCSCSGVPDDEWSSFPLNHSCRSCTHTVMTIIKQIGFTKKKKTWFFSLHVIQHASLSYLLSREQTKLTQAEKLSHNVLASFKQWTLVCCAHIPSVRRN